MSHDKKKTPTKYLMNLSFLKLLLGMYLITAMKKVTNREIPY